MNKNRFTQGDNIAKARLIAAAPEMLAALKCADEALENAYNIQIGCLTPDSTVAQYMALVKAAIAKATGKPLHG